MSEQKITAYYLGADGTYGRIELATPIGDSIRQAIGCRLFDVVNLAEHVDMFVDDEGLLVMDPQVNYQATEVIRMFYPDRQVRPIYGDAVVTGLDRTSGETVDLDPGIVKDIEGWLAP